MENPNPFALKNEYRNRFSKSEFYRDSVWKILCKHYFSQYIPSDSIILDLGAGWGEFSRNITAKKKFSMDLNPDCSKQVSGFSTFIQQDCSDPWPFQDSSLDVVFSSNFFEHLPRKSLVDQTLKQAFRCLKPGGIIICMGPNIRYLYHEYWKFWDHYIPISHESMTEALELQGFSVTELIPRFLPYTMSAGFHPPVFLIKTYLKLKFSWRIFGKQFLIVAKKSVHQ
jgi:SAM-dependent methyltransferase